MTNVILVIHILVSIILIAVVLMQRSEGGALGIGGGGGGAGGGLMSGRGVTGALVRTTIIFGAIFFVTSIGLTTLASRDADGRTEIERNIDEEFAPTPLGDGAVTGSRDLLDPDTPLLGDPLDAVSDTPVTEDPLATQPAAPEETTTDPLAETPDPLESEAETEN